MCPGMFQALATPLIVGKYLRLFDYNRSWPTEVLSSQDPVSVAAVQISARIGCPNSYRCRLEWKIVLVS